MLFALQELMVLTKAQKWLLNHVRICEKIWVRYGFIGVGDRL